VVPDIDLHEDILSSSVGPTRLHLILVRQTQARSGSDSCPILPFKAGGTVGNGLGICHGSRIGRAGTELIVFQKGLPYLKMDAIKGSESGISRLGFGTTGI
jgi:hypothetical protein